MVAEYGRLTLGSKCNVLSFQETLVRLYVPVFGVNTNDPEEWSRVTESHDGWDGTEVLLEA